MGNKIGYARVSSESQDLNLQIDALKAEGCTLIFTDKASGVKAKRSGFEECMKKLKKGDTLVVWRLDRLGRSMPHLVSIITELKEKGIEFKSLCDGMIDTTSASGELIFNIFASLAQFERALIRERTNAGLTAARARGRTGGRKPVLPKDSKVRMSKKLYSDKSMPIKEICSALKISRATLYRYVAMPDD